MSKKNIVLEEDTRITYNKARAKILEEDPEIIRLTDDLAVKILSNKLLGGK